MGSGSSETLRPPIALMAAAPVTAWPAGDGWLYEVKLDGWRMAAFRQAHGVVLQSRTGTNLTRYFPDVAETVAALPLGTVIDAEAVIWVGDRVDFTAVQRRISRPVDPAHLVAFDLLQHPALGPILHLPLTARRGLLAELLDGGPSAFALCPQTDSVTVAETCMTDWTAAQAGVEGVVIKAAAGRYRLGTRGWLKRRAVDSTELLVGGITGSLDHPHTLLLGRRVRDGRVSYVGRTGHLTPSEAADIATSLARKGVRPESATWPSPLPARWVGFHQSEPLPYVAVTPIVVVEVAVDTAFDQGRYRHPVRFLRNRPDVG